MGSDSMEAAESPVLPRSLQIFCSLAISLTIVSLLFSLVSRLIGLGLPYSFAYYYVPGDMFGDLVGFRLKVSLFGSPEFFSDRGGYFMYPAPMFLIVKLLTLPRYLPRMALFALSVFSLSAFLATHFNRTMKRLGVARDWRWLFLALTVITSYPLMFGFQRANLEFFVWLVTSVGVWCFYRDRPYLSAVMIGIAISLKLYPFILLGMFFSARKYRAMALSLAVAAIILVSSYAAIGPTIASAYAWNARDLSLFSRFYAGIISQLGYDHSLFALVKFLSLKRIDLAGWVRPYTLVAACGSLVLYFARIRRLPLPNQILALGILSIILPPVSYDYTLLNMYPAFTVLACLAIRGQQGGRAIPHLTAYMVLFALIFTPQSYVILYGAAYGAQLRAVCLIGMLVMALAWPLPTETELLSDTSDRTAPQLSVTRIIDAHA